MTIWNCTALVAAQDLTSQKLTLPPPGSADMARLSVFKKRVRRHLWIIAAAIGIFGACLNQYQRQNDWADSVGSNMNTVGLGLKVGDAK